MTPDIAASIRARLLQQAHATGEEFERTLVRYGAERWLYRLSISAASTRCVLKGASLLAVWLPHAYRATRDVDLLAFGAADAEAVPALIAEVCQVSCVEDGLTFNLSTLDVEPIRPDEEYPGIRARFWASLRGARIRMQVDVGFGDAVSPSPQEVEYPTMLSHLPPPRLLAYPREACVAEKFEAMVKLDRRNSRMKDFHDVWALSTAFAFHGSTLQEAITACFGRRGARWSAEPPAALTPVFYQRDETRKRWQAYLKGGDILVMPPSRFEDVGEHLIRFLKPVRDSIVAEARFSEQWPPGGPWETAVPTRNSIRVGNGPDSVPSASPAGGSRNLESPVRRSLGRLRPDARHHGERRGVAITCRCCRA